MSKGVSSESIVRDFHGKNRKKYYLEEAIRIVWGGLRGEDSIANLSCREGISLNFYYHGSKAKIS